MIHADRDRRVAPLVGAFSLFMNVECKARRARCKRKIETLETAIDDSDACTHYDK